MYRRLVNIIVVATALLTTGITAYSQSLYWSADFNTVFDNRECDVRYTSAKTYFRTQLAPEIGVSLLGDSHRLAGGVVWNQPIGCEWDGYRLSPTLYYRFQCNGLRVALGMFGREQLYRPLPNYIWSDSVNYSQRNIRGAMVAYADSRGMIEAVVDWRGMQTETRREAFNIIVSGERLYRGGLWMWGGTAMMNHLAKVRHAPDNQFVVDNFVVNPYVGVDLSKSCFAALDSCSVRVGALTSLTRNRSDMKWRTPVGLWTDIDVAWRWLEVKNTLYLGGALFPWYGTFGSVLDQGEPYYASGFYNRTSVFATLLGTSFMNLRAGLDFNFAEHNFTFYQRLILRVYVDASVARRSAPKLRPLY